jgi:hypothetical protein
LTVTPPLAGRSGKILSRFPAFMGAPTPGKVLAAVATALGADMDEAERLLMQIQQSHRLAVALEERDLLGLAGLCDLHEADFFIVELLQAHDYFAGQLPGRPPGSPALSDQDRCQGAYDLFLGRLRADIGRAIAVLLEGCGTIWALLEGTAILLDADRLDGAGNPDPTARIIQHLDDGLPRGGFVHRMAVGYHTWQPTPSPGAPLSSKGWVYLVENPLTDQSTNDTPRRQREGFRVNRGGFFDGQVAIQVTGIADRTVRPMVINETDHEGFFYADVVKDGQKLVLTTDGKVLLNGTDVTAKAAFFTGALVDTGADLRSRLAPADQPAAPAPSAAADNVVDVVTPPGALDRVFPRPALTVVASLPPMDLRLGESSWRFSVEEGAYDLSAYEQAVYAFPEDATMGLPPSGKVQLTWKENEPFAASVLIPSDLKMLEDAGVVTDLPALVRAGLERYRAAGIRLDVSYFDQEWVLGHSVLQNLDAAIPTSPTPAPAPPPTPAPAPQ